VSMEGTHKAGVMERACKRAEGAVVEGGLELITNVIPTAQLIAKYVQQLCYHSQCIFRTVPTFSSYNSDNQIDSTHSSPLCTMSAITSENP
jgi:hypothetical protein